MPTSCRRLAQTSQGTNKYCKQIKCQKCDKVLIKYFHVDWDSAKVNEHLRQM